MFSIHGNHDDPQGTGADGALCALDVLSVSGLVNYFGKIDLPVSDANAHTSGIAVRPILLRKGNTYLGLYGMGNVRDQRMHFELRSNRVRMYMPKNKDDWFNVLLLHQNRYVCFVLRAFLLILVWLVESSMDHRNLCQRACSTTV